MKKLKIPFLFIFLYFFFINSVNSIENKILFKINNEIITTLDIYNELRYLGAINEQFKNTEKIQAFEIAKKSLIREKIKEIELKKIVKEIIIEDRLLENILINYFKKNEIKSISDFNKYFSLIGLNSETIKKKVSVEVLWNQLIYKKFIDNIKIDKKKIINDLKKNKKQTQFNLSEIFFILNENEKLDNKFNTIKNKINGSNFSEAALIYSISDTSTMGGELGWIDGSALSEKIKTALQGIKIGNYSNPIVLPGGFLILKIKDIREKDNNSNLEKDIEKIVKIKTNEQLNQFSNIFFNKIQKDITINEL